jgi:hypothetical protein
VSTVPDVHELVGHGVAVVVATRDDDLRPAVSRAWGPQLSPDEQTLTLCVDAQAGSQTAANLVAGGQIAVTISRPSTYGTAQLKGRLTEVRPPADADRECVAAHVEGFVTEVKASGLQASRVWEFSPVDLVAVVIEVLERYDQTPGAGAGKAL